MPSSSRNDDNNNDGDPDTFKILVSTDNHLGYNEECPIRAQDSFDSFEEVLQIAQERQVDFVLLGGDLFHKNKPTRRSMFKCMNLLRKYSLGDKPCNFEIISDPVQSLATTEFPWANHEDVNLNVGIPVFSINGNHDDPTGSENLCALDVLSASGLVNFFGKVSQLDEINVSPIIFKKGRTKLCLFGLSSVRDERLHRMFVAGKVNIKFPQQQQDQLNDKEGDDAVDSDWFNLFVLHQNHVRHTPTNHIPESFLHPNLHLVIWGHEHEAMDGPVHNATQDFYVLQPGSSVATSLCQSEASPKNTWIIHVRGNQFKADKVPLKTVRPFVLRDINLFEDSKIDPKKPKYKEKVNQYCCKIVDEMIEESKRLHSGHPKQPVDRPLIRLRVHYCPDILGSGDTGGPSSSSANGSSVDCPVNVCLFGKQFVEQVANAKDIITLHRQTDEDKKDKRNMLKELAGDFRDAIESSMNPKAAPNLSTTVVGLVKRFFHSADQSDQRYKLSVLTETGLSLAVQEFAEKEETDALHSLVDHQVRKTVNWTVQSFSPKPPSDDTLFDDEIVKYRKERLNAAKTSINATGSSSSRVAGAKGEYSESQEEAMSELAAALEFTRSSQRNSGKTGATDLTGVLDSDNEDNGSVLESTTIAASRGGRGTRGAKATSSRGTRGRGSRGGAASTSTRGSRRGASTATGLTTLNLSRIAAAPSTTGASSNEPQLLDSDDSDAISASSNTRTATSRRTAPKRGLDDPPLRSARSNIIDEDSDDNDEVQGSANIFSGRSTTAASSRSNTSQSSWNTSQRQTTLLGNSAKLAKRF